MGGKTDRAERVTDARERETKGRRSREKERERDGRGGKERKAIFRRHVSHARFGRIIFSVLKSRNFFFCVRESGWTTGMKDELFLRGH